jgi:hypothetical protein
MMNMKLCILKMTFNELMVKWVYEFINLYKSSCCAFFFPYLPWRLGKGIGKHMSICLVNECIAHLLSSCICNLGTIFIECNVMFDWC